MQLTDELGRAPRKRLPRPDPFVAPSSLRRPAKRETVLADATFRPSLPCRAEAARTQRRSSPEPKRIPVLRDSPPVHPLEVRAAELPEPSATQVALDSIRLGVVGNLTEPTNEGRSVRERTFWEGVHAVTLPTLMTRARGRRAAVSS
jgi:hypothetical protein